MLMRYIIYDGIKQAIKASRAESKAAKAQKATSLHQSPVTVGDVQHVSHHVEQVRSDVHASTHEILEKVAHLQKMTDEHREVLKAILDVLRQVHGL